MADRAYLLHGIRILECDSGGPKLKSERDAVDLIGAALSQRCEVVVVPVERLDADFFVLKTRIAGEFVQKFVNYERCLVILGDIARYVASSDALRDFVREANGGKQIWFVSDRNELERRLSLR